MDGGRHHDVGTEATRDAETDEDRHFGIVGLLALLAGLIAVGSYASIFPRHDDGEWWHVLLAAPALPIGCLMFIGTGIELGQYLERKFRGCPLSPLRSRAEGLGWIIAYGVCAACLYLPFYLNTSIRI